MELGYSSNDDGIATLKMFIDVQVIHDHRA